METKHRNILRSNRMKIALGIENQLVIEALFAANILSENDVEIIKLTPFKFRNEKLLDILPGRGPKAFDVFLEVLRSIDKVYLLGEEFELKLTEPKEIEKMNEEKPSVKNGGGGGEEGYDLTDAPPPSHPLRAPSADNDMDEEFYDTVDSYDTAGPVYDEVPIKDHTKKIEDEEPYDMVDTPPPPPAPVKEKEPTDLEKEPTDDVQPAKKPLMINTDSTDFPANDDLTDGPPSASSRVTESEDGPFGRIGTSKPKATSPPADIVESASPASQTLFTNNYQMKNNPRGHFLLINNKDFLPGSTMENYPRNGTDLDAAAMEKLFQELGYIVSSHKNVTCLEMKRLVKKMATLDHSRYSAVACCFLSHGKEGILYGTDGEIEIRDLTIYFGENKTLVGKPKMFFFQACQGSDYMDSIQRDGGMEVDGPGSGETMDSGISLPTEADFVYAYSTVPGYYSWRNSRDGSWFIQRFVEACRRYAHKMDLLRILTRVNQMVSENKSRTGVRISHNKRQIPSIVTQLRYELYLMPPNGPLKVR